MKNKWWIEFLIGWIFFIPGAIVLVLGLGDWIGFLNISHDPSSFTGLIIFLVGLAIMMVGLVLFVFAVRYKRTHCDKCGKKFDYQTDVSWEDNGASYQESNDGRTARITNKVHCHCVCSQCGAEKDFNVKVQTGYATQKGASVKSVEKAIKEYFKAK
jgi:hypothetical protein